MGKAHFHANFFEAARVVLDDRKVQEDGDRRARRTGTASSPRDLIVPA